MALNSARVKYNGDDFSAKDVIIQYLRELELVQKMLDTLEKRLNTDVKRVENGLTNHTKDNDKDIDDARAELAKIRADLSSIELKVNNMLHDEETRRKDADHKHDLEIRTIQLQMAGVGAASGIASGLLSEPVLKFISTIIIELIH